MKKHLLTSFAAALILGTSVTAQIGDTATSTIINNKGKRIGHATFTQGNHGVVMEIKVSKLPKGKHGMHFHKVGTCEDHHHFKKAKGHIMPTGIPHGFLHPKGPHEGNLPNLIVSKKGKAHVELYTELVSINGRDGKPALLDADGSTLIIHENPDDHATQPIGGAGRRIACGVIRTK